MTIDEVIADLCDDPPENAESNSESVEKNFLKNNTQFDFETKKYRQSKSSYISKFDGVDISTVSPEQHSPCVSELVHR